MSKNDSKFVTKLSPLIENQVPDFVQADHPIFVQFLKHYYQFLEAGKLEISAESFYIRQETTTTAYILEETDGDRVVTEAGDGSTGIFVNGETITGSTTKATATVLVENVRNGYIFISSQQKFETGETITGATSGATATITKYRANPVQNIQQLLEYANTDNTIYDFLDQLRNSFMNTIPSTLATGVSKRNLVKNIRELYTAKGTSEGHKIFMRLFLGETPEIIYPNQYMMRNSDGNWGQEITIRVAPFIGVTGDEAVNQIITGQTSGATAIVVNSFGFQQGTTSVTEFVLQDVVGTFSDGEIVTATSTTRDVEIKFTVTSILSTGTIVNDGILHSSGEDVTVENVGNGFASVIVDTINSGSVSGVEVDSGGTLYEVGDVVTFTAQSTDASIEDATGFVSMIGGGIQQETGTLDNSSVTTDTIILEDFTDAQLEPFKIELESTQSDKFIADGSTTAFTLTESSTTTDTLTLYIDNVLTPELNTATGITTWSASGTTVTFTTAPDEDVVIEVYGDSVQYLLVDGHDVNGDGTSIIDVGHQFETEAGFTTEIPDTHTTDTDQIVLEFDTFKNLDASSTESGSIQKVHVSTGGIAYTKLPTASITSTSGTGASLIALTDNIGSIKSLKVTDSGYNYSVSNPPDIVPRSHFIVKDVTGTFASGNLLTSHTGTVRGFDSNTNVLDADFENVVRVEQEQSGTFNEGIQLEEGTGQQEQSSGILLEDEQDFDDGENIVFDGTGTSTTQPVFKRYYVTMVRNADDTSNVFAIDGIIQPTLRLQEGSTYYFDLSDSSLYNDLKTKNHQLKFSTTSDGTHNSGSAYTDGVTTSASYIEIGTTGAYIQIVVATGAPDLYYYCVNHSGMGGFLVTPPVVTTIDDENDSVLLNGSSNYIQNLLLEDIFENGELRLEASAPGRPSRILIDQDDTGDGSTPGINQGAFIVLESGNDSTGSSFLQAEDNEGTQSLTHSAVVGGTVLLEGSQEEPNATVNNENGRLRIDRYRERETSFLVFDGYVNDAGDIVGVGDVVASEDVGNTLVLERTDLVGASGTFPDDEGGSDARDGFLLDDETGDGQILLNATATGSIDDGSHIINEDPIDFSNSNVTITDAGGATATIFKADIATATSSVSTTATTVGEYTGIRSLVGEDLNRIQDSYYYQDYSYVVKIGNSIADWRDSIKKATHPAGFQVFGQVTFSSLVSANIQTPAAGSISGFTGDTETFTPELASTFTTLFTRVLGRRLGTATDDSTLNANALSGFDENTDGGGTVLPSGKREVTLTSSVTVNLDGTRGASTTGPFLKNLSLYGFMKEGFISDDENIHAYYTIDQFSDFTISDAANPFTTASLTTRINVPPRGEIRITKTGMFQTFDMDFRSFDDIRQTFDEDNIVGNYDVSLGSKDFKANRVRAGFFNKERDFQGDFAVIESGTFRTADNNLVLERAIELPFTTDKERARMIATINMKQSRQSMVLKFTTTIVGLRAEVGDVIFVKLESLGFETLNSNAGKRFRVQSMNLKNNDEVDIVAQEYDADVYDFGTISAEDTAPNTDLPDVASVDKPTNIQVDEDLIFANDTVFNRLNISWTPPTSTFVESYEISVFKLNYYNQIVGFDKENYIMKGTANSSVFTVDDLEKGLYKIMIRAKNTKGVFSNFATLVNCIFPPPDAIFSYAFFNLLNCFCKSVIVIDYMSTNWNK